MTADITFQDDIFFISGNIHFANVMSLYKQGIHFLKRSSALTFDFSHVKSSDSAGLALVIEWLKFAKRHKKQITFLNLPENLKAIADVGGDFCHSEERSLRRRI